MIFIKFLSKLPFSFLYFLSDILYIFLFYIFKYRKKVVLQNLRIAFPHFSNVQIKETAKEFYKNLSDIFIETIKAYSISSESLKSRVTITNKSIIDEYISKNTAVIVMTSHLGNWEWLLLSNCLLLGYNVDAVYKKIKNKFFQNLMLRIRSRFGANMVEKDSLLRDVVRKKSLPRIIAMVSDQSPASSTGTSWYKFFNREVPFYAGAEKIAHLVNYPVLFVSMKRIKRGYYEVSFEKISDPPYEKEPQIIARYINLIEKAIRENPSDWLWSHKRWKHGK